MNSSSLYREECTYMAQTEEQAFIEEAFHKLMERGWVKELLPSSITMAELEDFEKNYHLTLPLIFKEYVTAYQLPEADFYINGIVCDDGLSPLWLMLNGFGSLKDLTERLESFCEDVEEGREATAESCRHLLPIGDWGAGWGPLCLDLTKSENDADEDDESTWTLVWFDHEEFNWAAYYGGADGRLHGRPAAPNLRTLLKWYFWGSMEKEFEEEYQVKVNYERLNHDDFCDSYWEDRWKE